MSKNRNLFQPSYWPDSRPGNLPKIFASDAVEVAVKSERSKGYVLPPIVQPTQPTVENTASAMGRSGSFNLAQNDRFETLNDYKSCSFLNNRSNVTVIDGKVPNRGETMVEGLVRRDSTGQRASVAEPHPRAGLDTTKSRKEKTVFQGGKGSMVCPTSENVIIEEIYRLSLNKRAVPMEHKPWRQGIRDHLSPRETRRDETNGARGIHRCGEILSRRFYFGGSTTDLSSSEELGTGVGMAREPRRQSGIRRHRSLRKSRSDESNGSREICPCGKTGCHRLATTSNASLHVNDEISRVVNMKDETRAESEERNGQRISREGASEDNSEAASAARSEQQQLRHLQGVSEEEAKGEEEELFTSGITAESVNRQRQRRRRQGVSEANIETRDNEEETLACGVTAAESIEKQKQPRRLHRVSKANLETRGSKEESLACGITAESTEKRKKQRERRHSVSIANIETSDGEEERLACGITAAVRAESVAKQERRRRDGVCETVDETAASRRRMKVLKKKLFGDDLPVEYELMTEHTIGRALNKRL